MKSPTVTEAMKVKYDLLQSAGADAIPVEIYMYNATGGLPTTEKLTKLFKCMWRKEAIPKEFNYASIIYLFKLNVNP